MRHCVVLENIVEGLLIWCMLSVITTVALTRWFRWLRDG